MGQLGRVLVVSGGVGRMCAAICRARGGIAVELVEIKRDWNMHRERVALISDAARSTAPHMAYGGAGLAVEDAVVLSELIELGLPVPAGPPGRLQKIIETVGAVISEPV
jgi:hypothetical protein